jgi:hypothetical protein
VIIKFCNKVYRLKDVVYQGGIIEASPLKVDQPELPSPGVLQKSQSLSTFSLAVGEGEESAYCR